jgi:hypothetical protein
MSSSRSLVAKSSSKRSPAARVGRRTIWPISVAVGGIRSYWPAPSFSVTSLGSEAQRGYMSAR